MAEFIRQRDERIHELANFGVTATRIAAIIGISVDKTKAVLGGDLNRASTLEAPQAI